MITRTPIQTTEKVLRKVGGMKQIALYEKLENLKITGGNPEDHQSLAADIHKFIGSHPLVVGGKGKRRLHVTHTSTVPKKIFDGIC
jgi:hypothetical protein